jgi:hypothetical protein
MKEQTEMNAEQRTHLKRVIEYLWQDEHRDYDLRGGDENKDNANHIFHSVQYLAKWLRIEMALETISRMASSGTF